MAPSGTPLAVQAACRIRTVGASDARRGDAGHAASGDGAPRRPGTSVGAGCVGALLAFLDTAPSRRPRLEPWIAACGRVRDAAGDRSGVFVEQAAAADQLRGREHRFVVAAIALACPVAA